VNDYYQTPWGALYWSDWPAVREGLHGWLPGPVAQGPRPGRPLALPATAGAPRPPTLEVTKIHNGRRAICQVGTLIVIRLPGNPTTGYQWTALPASNPVMRLVGPPQYAPAAGLPGAGGQFVFTFQAIRPGTGSIRLVYARPWDRSAPAADSFSLGVEVQPGAATN
jgi:predicted secreted protein